MARLVSRVPGPAPHGRAEKAHPTKVRSRCATLHGFTSGRYRKSMLRITAISHDPWLPPWLPGRRVRTCRCSTASARTLRPGSPCTPNLHNGSRSSHRICWATRSYGRIGRVPRALLAQDTYGLYLHTYRMYLSKGRVLNERRTEGYRRRPQCRLGGVLADSGGGVGQGQWVPGLVGARPRVPHGVQLLAGRRPKQAARSGGIARGTRGGPLRRLASLDDR